MAKLKARGRQEIVRLTKEMDLPNDDMLSHAKIQVALMSDGNILKRRVVTWRDRGPYSNQGTHDYGWKVAGKIKAGLTPENFVEIYGRSGYAPEGDSSAFVVHRRGSAPESLAGKPIRTQERADAAKRAKEARTAKPKPPRPTERAFGSRKGERRDDGPGLYITNQYLGGIPGRNRAAELGPFSNLNLAEDSAWARYNEFRGMSLDYLLPVKVIEAKSRREAEADVGHTWWIDGRRKGPPVDPRQTGFGF
jgi:hypothetical protein